MSTLEEDLRYLMETKELIRQAIFSKGIALTEAEPFRKYVEAIDQIGGEAPIKEKYYGTSTFNYKGSIPQIIIGEITQGEG